MSGRTILLIALAGIAAASTAFSAALLFAPGFDAAVRWRLHVEDRGYGSFAERLNNDHLLKDLSVGEGRIVLIGDSHAAGLDQSRLGTLAVNYGIGGDTMLGVAERLPYYRAEKTARAIILIAGFNDLQYRAPEEVLESFESLRAETRGKQLYLVSIMPVRDDASLNKRIAETDALLRDACNDDCRYIDIASKFSALDAEEKEMLYLGDGVHLTPFAYEMLIGAIKGALCADKIYGETDADACS